MVDKPPYWELVALATAWANESRVPVQLVLRNLCSWILMGAFPEDSLITANGEALDKLRIFLVGTAVSTGSGSVRIGGWTIHLDSLDGEPLRNVLISTEGIRAFCTTTDTTLPSMLSRDFWGWFRTRKGKHSFPPACPEAESYAGRQQTRHMAQMHLASLREIVAGLSGDKTTFGKTTFGPRISGEAINDGYWDKRWDREVAWARTAISGGDCADLEPELEHLVAAWSDLNQSNAHQEQREPESGSAATQASDDAAPSAPDRSPRRYSRVAVEEWYVRWVALHEAGGNTPSPDEDLTAARAEVGDVPRDVIRELRKKLAPPCWHRKGRRKSAMQPRL